MNKRLIIPLAFGLLLPLSSFAAYDDVQLTTDTVLSVGGHTINVTGSTAAISSIVVDSSSFAATIETGASLTISSTDRKEYTVSSSPVGATAAQTCTDSVSQVEITLTGAVALTSAVVTVTPTDATCSTTTTTTTTTSGGGGGPVGSFGVSGGGGGGVGGGVVTVTPTVSSSSNSAETTGTAQTTTDLTAQLNALTSQLSSLSSSATFSKNLRVGNTGSDVVALQTWLEAQGFLTMPVGVAKGIYGPATKAAVIRYQKSVGISATGTVGPLTRARLNGGASVSAPNSSSMASGSFTTNLSHGSKGEAVTALQKFLEEKGFLVIPTGTAYGYYGPATKAAVLKYQQSMGIAGANGNFGPATRAKANGN